MKVLLLNQIPEVNNKYSFSLARGLMKAGVDVLVWGIEGDDVSAYSDVPHLNRFCSYSKIGNPLGKVISYTKSWRALLAYCLEEKIDIVHIQWCVFSPVDWKYHQLLCQPGNAAARLRCVARSAGVYSPRALHGLRRTGHP